MWVYIQSESNLFTVGFYDPNGKWHPDMDGTKEECANRCHWLNGGTLNFREQEKEDARGEAFFNDID